MTDITVYLMVDITVDISDGCEGNSLMPFTRQGIPFATIRYTVMSTIRYTVMSVRVYNKPNIGGFS